MIKLIRSILTNLLFRFGSNDVRVSIARHWGVTIGAGCRIFNCNFGSEPFLISIGDNSEVTFSVQFVTHDGATCIFRKNKGFTETKYGQITINGDCMIGINSIILPNIEIGPNSIVGAGSVVTKNVPPNTVYAGNPAKYIYSIDEHLQKCMGYGTNVPNERSFEEKKAPLIRKFGI